MSNEKLKPDSTKENRLVGPGLGLIIMGASYLVWWLIFIEDAIIDPRWMHNIAYAIIILNVGFAWYHKSPLSRTIVMIQAIMLPITGSGSINTLICTFISSVIFIIWVIVVFRERAKGKNILEERLSKRGLIWLNMHTLIIAWILVGHMGLMFFVVRFPLESQLYGYGVAAGYLLNLPPESLEFATWAYDIGLFILVVALLVEQFKMGYNTKNKPWPRGSFWIVLIVMAASLVALAVQSLTLGLDWVEIIYG